MSAPIIFVNIGWMVAYQGPAGDRPRGGHEWLLQGNLGHEAWNFRPHRGNLCGHVIGNGQIDISNLGALSSERSVENVTVVWVAKNPSDKVTYVVGWYLNATIYRDNKSYIVPRSEGVEVKYQICTKAETAKLLLPDQRIMKVPTGPWVGRPGRNPIWYGNPEFISRVRSYIDADGVIKPIARAGKNVRQADPELRKLIELAAVQHAWKHYESNEGGNRHVKSVESDNEGWDLTVSGGDVELQVEVKGLSGSALAVELTPNEFSKMTSRKYRATYVIYVVTNAGTSKAKSHVFRHNATVSAGEDLIWMATDGRTLKIEKRTGARLTEK